MKKISILINFETHDFEVFETMHEGTKKYYDIMREDENAPVTVRYESLKNYYGTVWIAYLWSNNNMLCVIAMGRWKDLKPYLHDGYKTKKIVFHEYGEM